MNSENYPDWIENILIGFYFIIIIGFALWLLGFFFFVILSGL